jgi:23S rRNA pseudouridine1911/1915/1917 synthase
MQEYTITVTPEDKGKRLDVFLCEFATNKSLGFSRTFLQNLITNGFVFIEGANCRKPHHKVKQGQQIKITIEEKKSDTLKAEDISLDVIYEDEDFAIINKPAGMVVHPAPGNLEHTLANALLHRFRKLSDINPARPGIVHRLDKDTSGIMVIVKTNNAHLSLAKQFFCHSIKRRYIALVKGKMEFDENIIEIPIGRHPYKRKSMSVGFGKNTRYAKTFYRTLKRTENYSLLELEPFTGRTHQLRVHLAFLGHPILGDRKYGKNNEFSRMALHAKYLGFIHPTTGKFVEFSSQMPGEFKEFLK